MTKTLDTINNLPSISRIKEISQSLAMLDAIIMPDWELRYFSFDCYWDESEKMASMRNGSGSEYFLLFNKNGVIGKVLIEKGKLSDVDRIELLSKIPSEFQDFKNEEAFSMNNISYCFWNIKDSIEWVLMNKNSNLEYLHFLTGKAEIYQLWAEEYYEKELNKRVIEDILAYKPISNKIIKKLNKEISLDDLMEDIKEIGYPYEL